MVDSQPLPWRPNSGWHTGAL